MMKKETKILIALFLVGAFLRIFLLGKYPVGFFRDEAALGYNAYSIWLTGKDEFGVSLPIVFRSFEVFFLPAYVYLSAPLVGLLDLSEFSTRLLSAISGAGALIVAYFIAKEIWNKKVALLSTLLLALSPWHIFYSRGAFEGNLALTFFAAGFLFWIKFLKKKDSKNFLVSTLLFALSMYSYQAERVVVFLFAAVAAFFSWRLLWEKRQKLIVPLLLVIIFLLPLLFLTLKPGGYHRAFGVSFFSQEEVPPGWIDETESSLFINNRLFLRGKQFLALYLSYFSPRNLFIEGDYNPQRSVEDFSVFYVFTLPFLIAGFAKIVKRRRLEDKLFLSWVFLAPIPASLTGDPFHTYRSLLLYLPLTVLIGAGLWVAYNTLKKRYLKRLFLLGVLGIVLVNTCFFLFSYLVITPAKYARSWDYGYREIVDFIETLPESKRVVVYDPWTEPYIHFLFYQEKHPSIYHEEVLEMGSPYEYYYDSSDEIRPLGFENYEFRKVDWRKERGDKGTVFVMFAETLPESEFAGDPKIQLLKVVEYPDGQPAFRIVEVI